MATGEGAGPPTEATLERMLTEVGPLLRRRARVGAPDPTFVWALRARLLETGTTLGSTGAHSPRGRGAGRDRRWRGAGAGLALAVALLALLVVASVALVWLALAVIALVAVALLVVAVGRRH